ncbi:MAG: hypothetical protein QF441_05230 [Bacteriovoracaceae bacterium]|jgi:hypothetical protein|nr:hypothetical protein [Halobacteriovoraceae bacterium]MDP7319987.1 hypothetical protein [Bacteriovoracaceae bacterium]
MSKKLNTELKWPYCDLVDGRWNDYYKVDKNAPFYFKINDNATLMNSVREAIKKNQDFSFLFNHAETYINKLKDIRVWLKLDDQVIQMNVYDIYIGLMRHFRDSSFEDQLFNSNEISFVGPLGPFKHMTLVECLNSNVVGKFIFTHVLRNKIPARKLRVYTKGKILIQFGSDYDISEYIEIRQITDTGILFSSKNDILLNTLEKSEMIKFYICTESLSHFMTNDLSQAQAVDDFFYTNNELRYFYIKEDKVSKTLSYRSGEDNEIYFFCRYHDMLESDTSEIFRSFVQKMNMYFSALV